MLAPADLSHQVPAVSSVHVLFLCAAAESFCDTISSCSNLSHKVPPNQLSQALSVSIIVP
jgi:hypothetical protein